MTDFIIPLNGWLMAERSAAWVAGLAPDTVGSVTLVRAVDDPAHADDALAYLRSIASVYRLGDDVRFHVEAADIADVLHAMAPPRVLAGLFVVLSTRARSGLVECFRRGTALALIARASAPVILLGPKCRGVAELRDRDTVLVCAGGGGSPVMRAARLWAIEQHLRAVCIAVLSRRAARRVPPPEDRVVFPMASIRRCEKQGVSVELRRRSGLVRHRLILTEAEQLRPACIAMASGRRAGFDAFVVDSVTNQVVQRADCPVLIVSRHYRDDD